MTDLSEIQQERGTNIVPAHTEEVVDHTPAAIVEEEQTIADLASMNIFPVDTSGIRSSDPSYNMRKASDRAELKGKLAAQAAEAQAPILALVAAMDIPLQERADIIRQADEANRAGNTIKMAAIERLVASQTSLTRENRLQQAVEDVVGDQIIEAEFRGEQILAINEEQTALVEGGDWTDTAANLGAEVAGWWLKGTATKNMLRQVFGVKSNVLDSLTGNEAKDLARNAYINMDDEERKIALSKVKKAFNDNSGLFFENEWERRRMLTTFNAVVGSSADFAKDKGGDRGMAIFDVALSAFPFKAAAMASSRVAGAAAEQGAKAAGKGSAKAGSFSKPDIDIDVSKAKDIGNGQELVKYQAPRFASTGLVKYTGVPTGSPADIMALTAPEASSGIFQKVLMDPTKKLSRKLGATVEDIADDFIAPSHGGEVRRGPDLVHSFTKASDEETESILDELAKLAHNESLYSQEEMALAVERINTKLEPAIKKGDIHASKAEYSLDEGTGVITARYRIVPNSSTIGAETRTGFSSPSEALEYLANKIEPGDVNDHAILKLNTSTGKYRKLEESEYALNEPGEYLLDVEYSTTLAGQTVTKEKMFKRSADMFSNHLDTIVSYNNKVSSSVTRMEFVESKADDLLNSIMAPMGSLAVKNPKLAGKVWDVLREGAEAKKTYTEAQLLVKLPEADARAAYHAVRKMYDVSHGQNNRAFREYMKKEGYRSITKPQNSGHWYVKPTGSSQVNIALDSVSGKVIRVTKENRKLYDFYENIAPVNAGKNSSTTFIAAPKGKPVLKPIPGRVLYKERGYLGRGLDANYVVEETIQGMVNGVPGTIKKVTKIANSPKAALSWVKGRSDPTKYTTRRMRERREHSDFLQEEIAFRHDAEMMGHTKPRMDLDAMDLTHKQHLKPPAEMLDQTAASLSRTVGVKQWEEYMTAKWEVMYGEDFGVGKQNRMPINGRVTANGDMTVGGGGKTSARQKEAQALRDKIALVTGTSADLVQDRLMRELLGAAEWAAIASTRAAGTGVKRKFVRGVSGITSDTAAILSKTRPDAFLKNVNHQMHIAFNPTRMFTLQQMPSFQYMALDGGFKYAASGKAAVDAVYIVSKIASKTTFGKHMGDNATKVYAKTRGITEDQAQKFFDELDESGLLQSVTTHQFLDSASHPVTGSWRTTSGQLKEGAGKGEKAWVQTKHTAGRVSNVSSKGFELGEGINLMSAYMFQRNKLVEKLGRFNLTSKEVEQVAIAAKQVAGNMGRRNKAAFQDGWAGVFFQFYSHTTKQIQAQMPVGKWGLGIGSDVLTNAEKRRLVAVNVILWGGSGMGVSQLPRMAADALGIELDDVMENILVEGFVGLAMQTTFSVLTDSDASGLKMSESFAPSGAITRDFTSLEEAATPAGVVVHAVINTLLKRPVLEAAGVTGSAISAGWRAIEEAIMIFQSPTLGTGDKLVGSMDSIMKFLPIYNKRAQVKIMAATGKHLDRYGNEIAEATAAEGWARMTLGVNADAKSDYYDMRAELQGSYFGGEEDDPNELIQTGKDLAAAALFISSNFGDGTLDGKAARAELQAQYGSLKEAYPAQQYYTITQTAGEVIDRAEKKESLESTVLDMIISDTDLHAEQGPEAMISKLYALPQSEPRDILIETLPSWFGPGILAGTQFDLTGAKVEDDTVSPTETPLNFSGE